MTEYPPPSQYPPGLPTPPDSGKKLGFGRNTLILGGMLFLGLIFGNAIGGGGKKPVSAPTPTATVTKQVVTATSSPPVSYQPSSSNTPTTSDGGTARRGAELKSTFEDGAWLVGRDVEAGTYTTEKEVGGMCYWARRKPGKEGIGAIIDNDVVTGGHPTVSIKNGEEFKSQDCGVWKRA
jgi:hypothetical protein